jgi:hypothetical protein
VGTYYVDVADGKKLTLEFTKADTLELLGKLTCAYSYDPSTGKGIIYDPASAGTSKTWGTFSLTTPSGSMMTLVIDGSDAPMKQVDKVVASQPAAPPPARPAAPPPAKPAATPPAVPAGTTVAGLNNWTKSNASVFTGKVNGVAFNGSRGSPKYIAVGEAGKMAESTDGATWTAITGIAGGVSGSGTFKDVIYVSSGQFVAIYAQGSVNRILASSATSTNGTQWSNASPSNVNPATVWSGITANSSQIVAVGTGSIVIFRAASGNVNQSWTVLSSAANKSPIADITAVAGNANGTKYIIGARNGMIAYTGAALSNSTTWTSIETTPFGNSAINGAVFGANKFVAVGAGGKIAYSIDGTTWRAVSGSPLGSADVVSVAYGSNYFVAVAANGKIAYSADGIAWTASSSTAFTSLSSVNAVGSQFVVGGATLTGLSGSVSP